MDADRPRPTVHFTADRRLELLPHPDVATLSTGDPAHDGPLTGSVQLENNDSAIDIEATLGAAHQVTIVLADDRGPHLRVVVDADLVEIFSGDGVAVCRPDAAGGSLTISGRAEHLTVERLQNEDRRARARLTGEPAGRFQVSPSAQQCQAGSSSYRASEEAAMPIRTEPWPAGTPCWVDLAAPDIGKATTFYGSVMGWSFVDSGEEFGHYTIAKVNGHDAAAIAPKMDPDQPPAWTVYLASDDVDATAAAITANGGKVLAPPMDIADNGRMTVGMDPAGAAFGVWQAGETIGAEIYNEPGGFVWSDTRLTDPDTARSFYSAVFGYHYQGLDGAPGDYTMFDLGGDPLGGMGGMMGAPAGTPSHWVAYFSVPDVDAAAAAATGGGGTLLGEPFDTQFGRMAYLTDPDGATFALAATPAVT